VRACVLFLLLLANSTQTTPPPPPLPLEMTPNQPHPAHPQALALRFLLECHSFQGPKASGVLSAFCCVIFLLSALCVFLLLCWGGGEGGGGACQPNKPLILFFVCVSLSLSHTHYHLTTEHTVGARVCLVPVAS
jgi:hypothetical protein